MNKRFLALKSVHFIALLICYSAQTARALELGAGPGVTTQGDGVMLPSIHGWISSSFGLFASSSLLEQKNTAFSQQFATARMGYMAPIPKLKKVFAHIALGGVLQRTLISEKNETLSRLDQWSHAAGLGVGTHWSPKVGQSFVWRLG